SRQKRALSRILLAGALRSGYFTDLWTQSRLSIDSLWTRQRVWPLTPVARVAKGSFADGVLAGYQLEADLADRRNAAIAHRVDAQARLEARSIAVRDAVVVRIDEFNGDLTVHAVSDCTEGGEPHHLGTAGPVDMLDLPGSGADARDAA